MPHRSSSDISADSSQPAASVSAPKRGALTDLILHLHPPKVPEDALAFNRTFGLGGMAVVLFFLLVLSGGLLLIIYEPTPEGAYESIISLQDDILFGRFVRSIHHWSGNILVIITFLHMLRVYYTGGFLDNRRINWVIGVFLLGAVLLSNFTGYLLPWDQLAFWAITISTGMLGYVPLIGDGLQIMIRGGTEIGPSALSLFFAVHVAVLPICLLLTLPFHFWKIRKAGGITLPKTPKKSDSAAGRYVATMPNLFLREAVVALVLIAGVLFYAILFNAPLEAKANPGMSPNPAKAPWFLVGFQELLLHFHPLFAVVIIPAILTIFLFVLPYLQYESSPTGLWFYSAKGRQMAKVSALLALFITPAAIIIDEYLINLSSQLPSIPGVIGEGLLPALLWGGFLFALKRWFKKKFAAVNNEAIQGLFTFLLVVFLILTMTGVWFRGQGMVLVWFWV